MNILVRLPRGKYCTANACRQVRRHTTAHMDTHKHIRGAVQQNNTLSSTKIYEEEVAWYIIYMRCSKEIQLEGLPSESEAGLSVLVFTVNTFQADS